ncbi:MAG: primosomal protein N' [Bacteroidales bacterium]|jgi:primosomal protein N' (replication factor Y)|nr:primosomal protein N' [Bacteroidales bacterium]
MTDFFADILLPLPLKGTFSYRVPNELIALVQDGVRVEVPFGKNKIYAGLVKKVNSGKKVENSRDIISVLDEAPIVNSQQFLFWQWMSEYYICSEGDVMAAALPPNAKRIEPLTVKKKKKVEALEKDLLGVNLTREQQKAYEKICEFFKEKNVCLLHGVTSSGKTEIYTKLIEDTLAQGKEVLYLLPEIALTTQMIMRLKKYFGEQVGVYHSRNTYNEKTEIWNNVGEKYKIILGARSAVFLPFKNVGLVVIDEEHETSFKQQDPAPRYNARDCAIYFASLYNAKTILGSATPSIETYNNALNGKYGLVELHTRYGNFKLPQIWISNMREEVRNKTTHGCFSSFLINRIGHALEQGRQIILFQNRRGFSTRLECNECGCSPVCRDCDVTLTYHKKNNVLMCHYCGYMTPVSSYCPSCGKPSLRMKGFGTERVEEDLSIIFPNAKVARMDLDSTRAKNAFQRLIESFQNHEIDILVGTQMVTKGLDFDNVDVVGILSADDLIAFPDFRSHERSFHLMTQVSGRAGRKGGKSDVVIQTYKPEYEVIRQVMNNDYTSMYTTQIQERIGFRYPPFYRLINVTIKHTDEDTVNKAAHFLALWLREAFGNRLLGPEYPFVSKVKTYHLMRMMLKFGRNERIAECKLILRELFEKFYRESPYKMVRINIDVDPY